MFFLSSLFYELLVSDRFFDGLALSALSCFVLSCLAQ